MDAQEQDRLAMEQDQAPDDKPKYIVVKDVSNVPDDPWAEVFYIETEEKAQQVVAEARWHNVKVYVEVDSVRTKRQAILTAIENQTTLYFSRKGKVVPIIPWGMGRFRLGDPKQIGDGFQIVFNEVGDELENFCHEEWIHLTREAAETEAAKE